MRERIFDLNLVSSETASYNPLRDGYLADFFQSPAVKKHLQKLGMVCFC